MGGLEMGRLGLCSPRVWGRWWEDRELLARELLLEGALGLGPALVGHPLGPPTPSQVEATSGGGASPDRMSWSSWLSSPGSCSQWVSLW